MFTTFWKNGLGHPTAFVYKFIGDDTEEKANILIFPGLGLYIEIKYFVAHFSMHEPWVTTQQNIFL